MLCEPSKTTITNGCAGLQLAKAEGGLNVLVHGGRSWTVLQIAPFLAFALVSPLRAQWPQVVPSGAKGLSLAGPRQKGLERTVLFFGGSERNVLSLERPSLNPVGFRTARSNLFGVQNGPF